jgi:hypothetical protein
MGASILGGNEVEIFIGVLGEGIFLAYKCICLYLMIYCQTSIIYTLFPLQLQ